MLSLVILTMLFGGLLATLSVLARDARRSESRNEARLPRWAGTLRSDLLRATTVRIPPDGSVRLEIIGPSSSDEHGLPHRGLGAVRYELDGGALVRRELTQDQEDMRTCRIDLLEWNATRLVASAVFNHADGAAAKDPLPRAIDVEFVNDKGASAWRCITR